MCGCLADDWLVLDLLRNGGLGGSDSLNGAYGESLLYDYLYPLATFWPKDFILVASIIFVLKARLADDGGARMRSRMELCLWPVVASLTTLSLV